MQAATLNSGEPRLDLQPRLLLDGLRSLPSLARTADNIPTLPLQDRPSTIHSTSSCNLSTLRAQLWKWF